MLQLVALAACLGLANASCIQKQIYVSPEATAGAAKGSTVFTNVQDAAAQVEYLLDQGDASTQVVVNIAPGTYPMETYLHLNHRHSGSTKCPVIWQAQDGDAVLSGGTKVSGWTQNSSSSSSGVWKAPVPVGSRTRALFVDGSSMPRARSAPLNQDNSIYTEVGFSNNGSHIEWPYVSKIQYTELRGVGTFVDRYAPVDYLSSDGVTLVMKQPAWYRQLIGYDTINGTGSAKGLYLENSLSLLDEEGEWYLDIEDNMLYYKPIDGKNPNESEIYLPRLEVLLVVGGFTYNLPAHDMEFRNISFAHTTWNFPSSEYGYPDQQTGGFIGERWNRSTFEATRPHWFQTPGTVQVSAAQDIRFVGGKVTCTGAAGMGIGNDENAHLSTVGLGASRISISGMKFTYTGGNAVQVGGLQSNAHHPIIPAMVNSMIVVENSYFVNNSFIYTSGANILFTYTQFSEVRSNTIINTPYSGICLGYGWGANDANGTPLYESLGLYNYQPVFLTPTVAHDNLIANNYIANVGLNHTDLGGIYTLSENPGSVIRGNVISNAHYWGLYFDEGSRLITATKNVVDAAKDWLIINWMTGSLTGNETVVHNWGSTPDYLSTGHDQYGDYIDHNKFFNASMGWPQEAMGIVKAAGVGGITEKS